MQHATPQFDNVTGQCIGQLQPTVSREVLEGSPGLQNWSAHRSPVLIFSAYRASNSSLANNAAHNIALRSLRRANVPHAECDGVYKGISERSIIVRCDTERHARHARILAGARRQESLLQLDSDRTARLITPQGEVIKELGKLRAVSHSVAVTQDAYTYANGAYYICE